MNYSELQTLIADYIDQDVADTRATTFIKLCEAAINKRLRTEGNENLTSIPGDDTNEVILPNYVGSIRDVSVNGCPLDFVTPRQIMAASQVGADLMYFSRQRFKLILNAAVATNVNILVNHHLMVPNLTDTETTNWLLEDWEDVYINGSIYEACLFHKDYDTSLLWKERFNESLQTLIDVDLEDRWSGAPNQIRGA